MPRDPVKALARVGAHVSAEAVVSRIQVEVHRGIEEVAARDRWSNGKRLLAHILTLAGGAVARAGVHTAVDSAFGPPD
jgi:hypothetical protein